LDLGSVTIGTWVRIREVRGSPRPPAQWLGKRARITASETAPRQTSLSSKAERHHTIVMDGTGEKHTVPESWLASAY
jgi:hypothetical protein